MARKGCGLHLYLLGQEFFWERKKLSFPSCRRPNQKLLLIFAISSSKIKNNWCYNINFILKFYLNV
jgi:hypothetical protein